MVTISEDTKINLKVNNIWAILVSVVISAFIVGSYFNALETKLDTLLEKQNELSMEFKEWKKQAETRIGSLEIMTEVNSTRIDFNGHTEL